MVTTDATKCTAGRFRDERCHASDCGIHGVNYPLHTTGYVVCDCGFRCAKTDRDAQLRHIGGLS